MLRQALILAAGRGRPVAAPDVPNCLASVGGAALLLRTLRVLRRVGVRRVGITVGFQAALVQRQVESWRATEPVGAVPEEIAFFQNPDWERPNGLSVLAARAFVTEPLMLVMADQIAAPSLVERLAARPPADTTLLGVDRELSRVFDIDDATKVSLDELHHHKRACLRVRSIGKQLTDYQAVSTSLFAMAPSLIDCLDALPEPSLTQGVAEAARRGLVEAVDVTGSVWQDVDSAEMRLHADWLLRAYGEELQRPSVQAEAATPASDTLALVERLLAEKDAPRYVLFNPGPVMTSARVKAALVHHDICHRDEDYEGVVQRLRAKLRPVFGASAQHDILLLTASGTAAMEAALVSGLPPGKKLLTISNGAFGERLGEIAETHRLPHRRLALRWGEVLEPEAVAELLASDRDIGAVAMMRHETSVGLLNPVPAIGKVCQQRDLLLLVDAVSALGADEVDMVADGIDICFSSSNKCLHSVAGVALVCVSPRVWARTAGAQPPAYYLDLARYKRAAEQLGQTPFTPAVSAFFALETALDELAEGGGVTARRDVYRLRNLRIRRVLTSLGFQSFTNTGRESHAISTLKVPPGVAVQELYDRLKQRGYVIYKAKGPLQAEYIQVANMGELPERTIDAFLKAITDVVEGLRAESETDQRSRREIGLMARTMRAALFRRHGGPEVMEVGEVPAPEPGPGEVLVRVRAAALNHMDLWLRRGLPALKVALPHVPGGDACGVVAGLGPGAPKLKEGDRVVINPGLSCGRCIRCLSGEDNLCPEYRMIGEQTWGGQAQYLAMPAANLVAAPEGVDDAELASLPTVFLTTWQMLVDKARVRPGETVLVISGASGVGVAAIQIAKMLGAHVLTTASTEEKLTKARELGAEGGLLQGPETGREIKRLTGGRGVDVVIEHTGAEAFQMAVKVCAKGGRIVTCGATAGHEPALNLRYVFWHQLSILGSTMAPKGRLHRILQLVAERKLRGVVDRVLPLSEVAEAHRLLEARAVMGKLVLKVD